MKIVPYRDISDGQMKKAILPQTQEEGELIQRAIMNLAKNPPEDLTQEDINDLAKMLEEFERTARQNPLAMNQ
jgi:hypothetical protein